MKKALLIILVFAGITSSAQNLQLHYDFADDRQHLTTTMEMFKPDKLGNTFFFIDMNYGANGVNGVSAAYWEIARVIKTEKMPLGINIEYNGGFGQYAPGGAFQMNDSWLVGPVYSKNADDFSKGITLKALYKYIDVADGFSGFQLTAVWYLHFWDKKMTFQGFADFWKQESDFNFDGTVDADYVFLAEPQIWYHLNEHFDLGSEIELSNNFGGIEGFKVRPTAAIKWTF